MTLTEMTKTSAWRPRWGLNWRENWWPWMQIRFIHTCTVQFYSIQLYLKRVCYNEKWQRHPKKLPFKGRNPEQDQAHMEDWMLDFLMDADRFYLRALPSCWLLWNHGPTVQLFLLPQQWIHFVSPCYLNNLLIYHPFGTFRTSIVPSECLFSRSPASLIDLITRRWWK